MYNQFPVIYINIYNDLKYLDIFYYLFILATVSEILYHAQGLNVYISLCVYKDYLRALSLLAMALRPILSNLAPTCSSINDENCKGT